MLLAVAVSFASTGTAEGQSLPERPPAVDISLEIVPQGEFQRSNWRIKVRAKRVPGHPPAAAHNVVVAITTTPHETYNNKSGESVARRVGITSGSYDVERGEWNIPVLLPSAGQEASFNVFSFFPEHYSNRTPLHFQAKIKDADRHEPEGYQGNNVAEVWFVQDSSVTYSPQNDVSVAVDVDNPTPVVGGQTTFDILLSSIYFEPSQGIGENQFVKSRWFYDVQVKVELSPGLSFLSRDSY